MMVTGFHELSCRSQTESEIAEHSEIGAMGLQALSVESESAENKIRSFHGDRLEIQPTQHVNRINYS